MTETAIETETPRSRLAPLLRAWGASIVIGVIVVPLLLIQPWKTYLNQGPIRSDGVGYFAWTRAVLDGEVGFCRYPQIELMGSVKIPRPTKIEPHAYLCANKYPPGLAILQFPVMAAFGARTDPKNPVSPAQHEASLWLGGLALIGTCLVITATARRLGAQGWGVQLGVIVFAFGAGLFPYGTYLASFVHVHIALLVSLLLWAGVRTHQQGRNRGVAILTMACGFFIVSMRNVDISIIAILAIAYAVWEPRGRDSSGTSRAKHVVLDLLPTFIGILGALLLQIAINRFYFGHFTLSSYKGEDFLLDRPFQREVLFSYTRGVFVYAPVALITLVAGVLVPRARVVVLLYGTLVAALTVIYGYWWAWALGAGAGYGHRGFIDIAPVGMLAAAMILANAKKPARTTYGILAFGATLWTMQLVILMLGYNYPEYTVDAHTYWSHTIGADSLIGRLLG